MSKLQHYEEALRKTFPEVVLLDHKEVGYPFYQAALNLTLRKDRDLLLQEEFTLRALAIGLQDRAELGSFLGVEDFFVDRTLSSLLSNELVQRTEEGLVATAAGRQALNKQTVDDIVIESKRVLVDTLTGEVHLEREFPLNPVKRPSHMISPVVPRVQADVTDFVPYIEDIQDALRTGEEDVELISIESVDWTKQVWHKLDLVTFRATPTADDVRYVFFLKRNIEPTYRERIERLQSEGYNVLEHLLSADLVSQEEREEHATIRRVIEIPSEVVERVETVKAELRAKRVQQSEGEAADVEALRQRIRELEEERQQIEQAHDIVDVIHTPELRAHLLKALDLAQQRLLIIVPWVTGSVVEPDFLKKLEQALKRGVAATILYGYKDSRADDPRAVAQLQKLAQRYSTLTFAKVLNTHSKVLACDHRFGISSSFNFLSFRADPNRTYRDETGILVKVPHVIDKLYEHGEDLLREASYLS